MGTDTISFISKDKWLVRDLYRFFQALNIFYNRLYVFNLFLRKGYRSFKNTLSFSLYYIEIGDELTVESLAMQSPAEFNLRGVSEIIAQIREAFKDRKFRNRQEEQFGEIELMRGKILLMKEAGYSEKEIKAIIKMLIQPVKKIQKQFYENDIKLIEDKPEDKLD